MRCVRPLILASVVPVAALALLAAGCGGGRSPQVASVASPTTPATTTPNNEVNGFLAFGRCMRSHGVPTFPETPPQLSHSPKPTAQQLGVSDSRFQAAANACRRLVPTESNGSQETAQQERVRRTDGMSFARCMRSHGVARFPDPTAQGELTVAMVQAQGIDIHSPAVLQAVQACLPASHGLLTPAKVRAALNNPSG
jgi:hypothetical protein